MWIKRTTEELVEVERRRKRSRIIAAILVALFGFSVVTFLNGEINTDETGIIFTPKEQIPQRLPLGISAGLLSALLVYFIRGVPTVVCTKCDAVKKTKAIKCECGGNFVDVEELKWIENKS